jgi:hypothetical protein
MRGPASATPTSESVIANPPTTATYQRCPATFVRRTTRSLVILAAGSEQPVRVSGSAVDVWDMLATPKTLDDLVAEIVADAGTAAGVLATDVAEALAVLAVAGAVVVAS